MPLEKVPKNIPHLPGVYYFKNIAGDILYIGKAKDLKKRVTSYFANKQTQGVRTQKMLSQAEAVEYSVVQSELESIILEANLIKQHQPKYNVIMKDDKNFVYIKVTTKEDFPRIELVRKIAKDGAKYFGPKTAAHKVKKTLKILKKIFMYRHCGLDIDYLGSDEVDSITGKQKHKVKIGNKVIKYPCIDFFIKRCAAPCNGSVGKEEYNKIIQQVLRFLSGDTDEVVKGLELQMQAAAENKQFEKAAQLRDKLLSIKEIIERQVISGTQHEFMDIIGSHLEDKKAYITLFQIRDGKLINSENFMMDHETDNEKEVVEAFIRDYYVLTTDFPKEILVAQELENKEALEELLNKEAGHKVSITTGERGKRRELIELTRKNAEHYMSQQKTSWESKEEAALQELQKVLHLPKLPRRIEGYDISHLGGTLTVASMVVFENGLPNKKEYRHFRIKSVEEGKPDDYASMKEVMARRLKYLDSGSFTFRKSTKKSFEKIKEIIAQEEDNIGAEEILNDENLATEFLCLYEEKELVGFVRIANKNEIRSLWVHPDKRGSKLGYKLLLRLIEKDKAQKYYVYVKSEVSGYYEKFGFKEVKAVPESFKERIRLADEKNGDQGVLMVVERTQIWAMKNSFSAKPDLIMLDGGKGQLSMGVRALAELKLEIAICSLAKRAEEIYEPGMSRPLALEKTNPALQLLQRVRNEAHRFAITYNKGLRKGILTTELDEIEGIGPKTRNKLLKHFKTMENVRAASVEELKGFMSENVAEQIKVEKLGHNT